MCLISGWWGKQCTKKTQHLTVRILLHSFWKINDRMEKGKGGDKQSESVVCQVAPTLPATFCGTTWSTLSSQRKRRRSELSKCCAAHKEGSVFSIKINAPCAQGKVVRTKRQSRCCLWCFILFRITCSEYDSLHNYWDKKNKTKEEENSNVLPLKGSSQQNS